MSKERNLSEEEKKFLRDIAIRISKLRKNKTKSQRVVYEDTKIKMDNMESGQVDFQIISLYRILKDFGVDTNKILDVIYTLKNEPLMNDVEQVQNHFGEVQNVSGEVTNHFGEVQNVSGEVQNVSGEVQSVSGEVQNVSGQVQNHFGEVTKDSGEVTKDSTLNKNKYKR